MLAVAITVVAEATTAVAHAPQTRASRANTLVTSWAMGTSRECCVTSNHAHRAANSRANHGTINHAFRAMSRHAFREMNNHAFRVRNNSAKTHAARVLI